MKIHWNVRSVTGLVFVILAVIGLLINFAGVIQVWVLREPVTQDAIATLDLLNSTLDTTAARRFSLPGPTPCLSC